MIDNELELVEIEKIKTNTEKMQELLKRMDIIIERFRSRKEKKACT